MITDKRLQELIDMHDCYKDIMEGSNDVLKSEYADLASSLLELQVLRKAIKQQGSILDSREELIIKLIKDGDKMAQILSDGEGKEDEICCVDFYHARDAVYKHAELMEQIEAEV